MTMFRLWLSGLRQRLHTRSEFARNGQLSGSTESPQKNIFNNTSNDIAPSAWLSSTI